MKLVRFLLLTVISLGLTLHSAAGQNTHFDKLSTEYKKTRQSQDSLQQAIEKHRFQLQNNESLLNTLSPKIIKLEDQLYLTTSKVNNIVSQMTEINRDATLNLIESYTPAISNAGQSRTLINNTYFTNTLPKKDINFINSIATIELKIEASIKSLQQHYNKLSSIKEQYEKASTTSELDSLLSRSILLIDTIQQIDTSISQEWNPIFERKLDIYMLSADRLNIDRSQMEQLQKNFSYLRQINAESSKYIAPNALLFQAQRNLLLQYELLFATQLNLNLAKDSIINQINSSPEEVLNMPSIVFEHRSLILYSDVYNDGKYDFTDIKNIPALEIPKQGVYYSIRLSLQQTQATSLTPFKNIRPLRLNKLSETKYQYMAGGFRKYTEAQAAFTKASRAGYRNNSTAILAWIDGKPATINQAKASEQSSAGKFRVEIKTQNQSLISELRNIVDSIEPGKQITRIQQNNTILFTISVFTDKIKAEQLVEAVKSKDKTETQIIKLN